jgi:hypothetical protein
MSEPAETLKQVPATVKYANMLYDAMLAESEPYPLSEDPDARVYHGKVTEVFNQLGISMSYYTPIRRFLTTNGCIEMVKRGGRGLASDVLLRHPPPEPLAEPVEPVESTATDAPESIVKIAPEHLTPRRHLATLMAEVEGRLDRLEAWRETTGGVNIAETMRNHESRITQLEKQEKQESK